MEQEFLDDFAVVLAGGQPARTLIQGEGGCHFDEWFSLGNSAEEKEMRGFVKNSPQLISVVADFALEGDEKLMDNALWLLQSLELGKAAPETAVQAARLGLKSSGFRCRMHAAGLVASIQDEDSYPESRRLLINILANEEFDDWEAVGAAAEIFQKLGEPSTEDRQRLQAIVDAWSKLVASRGAGQKRIQADEVHRIWDFASSAADYLGLRQKSRYGRPQGPWWNYEDDLKEAVSLYGTSEREGEEEGW